MMKHEQWVKGRVLDRPHVSLICPIPTDTIMYVAVNGL